mgnify:CR=1 FL=1
MKNKKFKNEGDVKKEVKKLLTKYDAWFYMPVQTGYGVHGIPDFVACVSHHFVSIETKFKNNKLSAYQEMQGEKIQDAGGLFLVINEGNLDTLDAVLSGLSSLTDRQEV